VCSLDGFSHIVEDIEQGVIRLIGVEGILSILDLAEPPPPLVEEKLLGQPGEEKEKRTDRAEQRLREMLRPIKPTVR
jgi:hypothetical protein